MMIVVPLDRQELLEFAAFLQDAILMDSQLTVEAVAVMIENFLNENNLKKYQYTTSDLYPDA